MLGGIFCVLFFYYVVIYFCDVMLLKKDNYLYLRFFMFKINKQVLVFVFAVFINLIAILFYMNARDGMHVDEQFSYGHSNSSIGAYIFKDVDHHLGGVEKIVNKWIDASIYKDYLFVSEENRFSYNSIVEKLSKGVHPPLYYVILHTVSSFYPDEFSKWFGLSINIVCYLLIAFGIYKLSKLIIGDERYALVCFCLWALSNIGISTILYIRMYALQTFFVTMLIYETGKIIKENKATNKGLFLIFLYSTLGILTQYNSIFFSFFIAASTGIVLLYRKNYSVLVKYSVMMLLSVLMLFIVFEPARDVLLQSERSKEAMDNSVSMLKDPLLMFDMEFYRFLKIYLYDFWNLNSSVNFVVISIVIIVYRWFMFRKYTFNNKKIKVLCHLCFALFVLFAYLGPVGALFLLFVFEKAKNFLIIQKTDKDAKIEKDTSINILRWSLGVVIPCILFIFVIMPYMGSYETRYIMAIMPFVAILSILGLIKIGNTFKINGKYLYVFLLVLVLFNGFMTDFHKKSVFRFQNTDETNEFVKNVKGKYVFVVAHEREPLLFMERGYYLKEAKSVYLQTDLSDENLVKEIDKYGKDMYVLVLEQNADDIFWGNPSFIEKNPEIMEKMEFVSKVILSERGYDLYKIK